MGNSALPVLCLRRLDWRQPSILGERGEQRVAYNGTLLSFGKYPIPMKFIKYDTYVITPNIRLDLDSYRDADGVLRRNALKHTTTKIEFETPALRGADMDELMYNLRSQYINENEKNAICSYYDPETGSYKSGEFYMPDFKFTLYNVSGGLIIYRPLRLAFIEY